MLVSLEQADIVAKQLWNALGCIYACSVAVHLGGPRGWKQFEATHTHHDITVRGLGAVNVALDKPVAWHIREAL